MYNVRDVPQFLWDDFLFISNDLVHFTTLLFLLKPFVNDAAQEAGTYFQNWYDARYLGQVPLSVETHRAPWFAHAICRAY